jgi:t-SNARE complex subunit (syntaxin)
MQHSAKIKESDVDMDTDIQKIISDSREMVEHWRAGANQAREQLERASKNLDDALAALHRAERDLEHALKCSA